MFTLNAFDLSMNIATSNDQTGICVRLPHASPEDLTLIQDFQALCNRATENSDENTENIRISMTLNRAWFDDGKLTEPPAEPVHTAKADQAPESKPARKERKPRATNRKKREESAKESSEDADDNHEAKGEAKSANLATPIVKTEEPKTAADSVTHTNAVPQQENASGIGDPELPEGADQDSPEDKKQHSPDHNEAVQHEESEPAYPQDLVSIEEIVRPVKKESFNDLMQEKPTPSIRDAWELLKQTECSTVDIWNFVCAFVPKESPTEKVEKRLLAATSAFLLYDPRIKNDTELTLDRVKEILSMAPDAMDNLFNPDNLTEDQQPAGTAYGVYAAMTKGDRMLQSECKEALLSRII